MDINDIYDKSNFNFNEYIWNEKGLRLGKNLLLSRRISLATSLLLIFALLVVFYRYSYAIELKGAVFILFSVIVLRYGSLIFASQIFQSKVVKLSDDELFDAYLYIYHFNKNRTIETDNNALLTMAKINILRGEESLSSLALEKIHEDVLFKNKSDVGLQKLFFMLKYISTKDQLWYSRYTGIPNNDNNFPDGEVIRDNLENEAYLSSLISKRNIIKRNKPTPVKTVFISIFLIFSMVLAGLKIGIKYPYELRYGFDSIASFILYISEIGGYVIFHRFILSYINSQENIYKSKGSISCTTDINRLKISKILVWVFGTILVLCLSLIALINQLSLDTEENIGKIDGKNILLIKEDLGYSEHFSYSLNPFFRKEIVEASNIRKAEDLLNKNKVDDATKNLDLDKDQNNNENSSDNDNARENDNQIKDSHEYEMTAKEKSDISAYEKYNNDVETSMKLLFDYLSKEGELTNPEYSLKYDAKGNAYAEISKFNTDSGNSTLLIRPNGEKEVNSKKYIELSLQVLTSGDSSEYTELKNFYLVDPSTKEIIDEKKNTW